MSEPADPPPQDAPVAAVEHALVLERERFAQMMHDTVCQSLTGLQFLAAVLARKLSTACPECVPDLQTLKEGLAQASAEAHELERSLRTRGAEGR